MLAKFKALSMPTKVSVALNVALASVAGVTLYKTLAPPTLAQVSQFQQVYNAADARVATTADPWLWEMDGTINVGGGVYRHARMTMKLDPEE